MKRPPFVDQTILYTPEDGADKGNCTEASVASLLGIPLADVPDFRSNGLDEFWATFYDFFRSHGYEAILMPGDWQPDVMYLATGPSPRGVTHMVIMQDGKLIHDPHPSKAGIGDVEHVWLVVPVDPAAVGAR